LNEKCHQREEKSPTRSVNCAHATKPSNRACHVSQLAQADLDLFFGKLYSTTDKEKQDTFLLKCMTVVPPKRKRLRKKDSDKRRSVTVKYEVLGVSVCAKAFQSIANIKATRLQNIARYWKQHKKIRQEPRGGHRPSEAREAMKRKIRLHIESFKCRDSHYSRSDSENRKYLPPELSVRKMWKLFKCNEPHCSYSLYYKNFCSEYNLGFGNPRSHVCGVCERTRAKIKLTQDVAEKTQLITELRVHKIACKIFL